MFSNGKVTLTSSTKTSLHDRFTKLAAASSSKEKAPPLRKPAPPPKIAPIKASAKNRNLAMQMANKPSVQAALKIKNKTLKQRLAAPSGVNRPNFGAQREPNAANRQNLRARLGGVVKAKPVSLANRLRFRQSLPANTGSVNPTARNNANISLSAKRNNQQRGQLGKQNSLKNIRSNNTNVIQRVNNNAGFKMKNKSPRIKNLRARVQSTGVKNFGRGAGAPNKKSLDMDLDEYMSKTKSHLDSDLDKYMAKSKSHLDADLDQYMSKATSQ